MALSQLKGKEKKLLKERDRLQKLAEIAKPVHRLPRLEGREMGVKTEQESSDSVSGRLERQIKEEGESVAHEDIEKEGGALIKREIEEHGETDEEAAPKRSSNSTGEVQAVPGTAAAQRPQDEAVEEKLLADQKEINKRDIKEK